MTTYDDNIWVTENSDQWVDENRYQWLPVVTTYNISVTDGFVLADSVQPVLTVSTTTSDGLKLILYI